MTRLLPLVLCACASGPRAGLDAASVAMEQVQLAATDAADTETELVRVERLAACWHVAYALAGEALGVAVLAPEAKDAERCAGTGEVRP